MSLGRLSAFGMAPETTRLTGATTATNWLAWQEMTMNYTPELFEDNSAFGSRAGIFNQDVGFISGAGAVGGVVDVDSFSRLMFYVFGSVSSVQEGATGAYTHTYTMLNNALTFPTFTSFYQYETVNNQYYRMNGCGINSLNLKSTAGAEALTFSADIMGCTQSTAAAQTPAYSALLKTNKRYILAKHITVGFSTTLAGLATPTAVADVQSFDVTMTNNVVANKSLGSETATNMLHGTFSVEGTMTAKILTTTLTTLQSNGWTGTKNSFVFNAVNPQGTLGTSVVTRPRVALELPPLAFTVEVGRELDDFTTLDIAFKGEFSPADGLMARAIVQSGIATLPS